MVPIRRSSPLHPSEVQALAGEVAKCLKLVAPAGMGAEQQTVWLHTAVDALEGIRASEIQAISAELRRTVTRPAQIVPEIARLVAEGRKRPSSNSSIEANNAERRTQGLGEVHWVQRDGKMVIEHVQPALPKTGDVMVRRGQPMTESDTFKLNGELERLGVTARYRSDGSRYLIT